MKDRFKFRVWDKENKIWLENEDCSLSMNGELTVLGMDAYGETIFCDSKNYLMEQSTGLKDKNDKLIYEGDIVTDGVDIFEVVWDYNAWCIQTNNFQHFLTEGFEVIGNIHENPDLLEQEDVEKD